MDLLSEITNTWYLFTFKFRLVWRWNSSEWNTILLTPFNGYALMCYTEVWSKHH